MAELAMAASYMNGVQFQLLNLVKWTVKAFLGAGKYSCRTAFKLALDERCSLHMNIEYIKRISIRILYSLPSKCNTLK